MAQHQHKLSTLRWVDITRGLKVMMKFVGCSVLTTPLSDRQTSPIFCFFTLGSSCFATMKRSLMSEES
eukprot:4354956-Amphidinium_carterae.1